MYSFYQITTSILLTSIMSNCRLHSKLIGCKSIDKNQHFFRNLKIFEYMWIPLIPLTEQAGLKRNLILALS